MSPRELLIKEQKRICFMMIRIVIVLLMFTANASAQNWKEISKAVAIEHKKLLGEAEKSIANSTVDYYTKLRDRTRFYNIELSMLISKCFDHYFQFMLRFYIQG